MFDWVPIYNYSAYFYLVVLISILLVLWQCHTGLVLKKDIASMNAVWGCVLVLILILYMGLRPIHYVFGDTMNYATSFTRDAKNIHSFTFGWDKEWLFYNLRKWCMAYSDVHTMFLICSIAYVGSLWLACARIFKNYYYVPLLVIFCMFTFWEYGVNGVRNGAGSSLFILAMTFVDTPIVALFIAFLGCGFHSSVYLMLAAAIGAYFIKNSYYYLIGWISCLGLSFAIGGRIQSFIAAAGLTGDDDRFTGYLTGSNMHGEIVQWAMVFRWDFVAYSAIGVAIGYYFIFRRHFKDEYYHWIYNTYLATNAFWLLIIRAAYSNRFAQISWFILPLVLIYPFMKKRFWVNHEKMLAIAICIFYAFGFYTNIYQAGVIQNLFLY